MLFFLQAVRGERAKGRGAFSSFLPSRVLEISSFAPQKETRRLVRGLFNSGSRENLACVAGAWKQSTRKNGRARRRHACLPRAYPFCLSTLNFHALATQARENPLIVGLPPLDVRLQVSKV